MRVQHTRQINWESFINATFHLFVDAFIEEINEVFDPRKVPKAKEELKTMAMRN